MREFEQPITSIFKNVILLSGTPDWKQVKITRENPLNACDCSVKTAIENGWICRPSLNLIKSQSFSFPAAVKAVFEREVFLAENANSPFIPTILVNCPSIDDLDAIRDSGWFISGVGTLFHTVSIHSVKKSSLELMTPEIDGKPVTSEEAYSAIERIDAGCQFADHLPVIVMQVQMIGEGINVSSFNAVVTSSCSDKTAMQQIGRAVRNFKVSVNGKTFTKVNDGHANIYVFAKNVDQVSELVRNLQEYGLTDDCYSWGKPIKKDLVDEHYDEHGVPDEVLEDTLRDGEISIESYDSSSSVSLSPIEEDIVELSNIVNSCTARLHQIIEGGYVKSLFNDPLEKLIADFAECKTRLHDIRSSANIMDDDIRTEHKKLLASVEQMLAEIDDYDFTRIPNVGWRLF